MTRESKVVSLARNRLSKPERKGLSYRNINRVWDLQEKRVDLLLEKRKLESIKEARTGALRVMGSGLGRQGNTRYESHVSLDPATAYQLARETVAAQLEEVDQELTKLGVVDLEDVADEEEDEDEDEEG